MAIKYKMPITIKTIESRYELQLERKRPDVCNLLKQINKGKKLESIIPVQSVYQSLLKQLVNRGYIDGSQVLQDKGYNFIENPYYSEEETGVYKIEFTELPLAGTTYSVLLKLTRTLANEENSSTKFSFDNLIYKNEVKMDNDEIVAIEKIVNKSRNLAFEGSTKQCNLELDLTALKYNVGYGYMMLGNTLSEKILNFLMGVFVTNIKYMKPSDNFDKLIIQDIKDIDLESLAIGKLTQKDSGFEIVDHPIQIDDIEIAKQYAYLYMYDKIINGEYLKYDEMNEIFENEVLSNTIYSNEIKTKMSGFTYSKSGFAKYLPKQKYDDMSYKLRVMEALLNYSFNDNSLRNVRNYADLVDYIANLVSPNDVKRVNFVLGYAFADNKKNQIIDCIEAFKEKYKELQIIQKNDGSNQKESESIKQSVIDHGITSKSNKEIGGNFHDRFIVFEMKDGTTKTLLTTNEVGQFFNLETQEPLGTVMIIPNDEVVKKNKSLYTMIKEAK